MVQDKKIVSVRIKNCRLGLPSLSVCVVRWWWKVGSGLVDDGDCFLLFAFSGFGSGSGSGSGSLALCLFPPNLVQGLID